MPCEGRFEKTINRQNVSSVSDFSISYHIRAGEKKCRREMALPGIWKMQRIARRLLLYLWCGRQLCTPLIRGGQIGGIGFSTDKVIGRIGLRICDGNGGSALQHIGSGRGKIA